MIFALPAAIAQAMARAADSTHPLLAPLPSRARTVLQAIVRCADKAQPRLPVWPSKCRLAAVAGLSERTVFRALDDLAQAGLIQRYRQDRRRGSNRLSIAKVALTALACRWLFSGDKKAGAAVSEKVEPSATAADGRDLSQPVQPISHPQQAAVAVDKSPMCRLGQWVLPRKLAWLCESGRLTPAQVCRLMRLFRARGQWLEEAVEVLRPRLTKIDCGLFQYLQSLLEKGLDFGAMLREQRRRQAELITQQQQAQQRRQAIAAELRRRDEAHAAYIRAEAAAGRQLLAAAREGGSLNVVQGWLDGLHKLLGRGAK